MSVEQTKFLSLCHSLAEAAHGDLSSADEKCYLCCTGRCLS